MAKKIPAEFLDLFKKRAYAHLATVMPDGSPHVSPVWVDFDGKNVIINSARGRVKDRNMKREGRVAVSIQDPDDPYRYLLVRGRVIEITEEGGEESIDNLAIKYTGAKYKWRQPGQVRVIYRIEPDQVVTSEH
jgi:PPOX class probable F420-dependent enzyme